MSKKPAIAKKLKTIAIKVNPPRMSRCDVIRKCNVGLAESNQTKTDGLGRSVQDRANCIRTFRDNYEGIFGHG